MSNIGEGTTEERNDLIVDVDGFSYFVVDKDRSKGDRRSDGKFTTDFFKIVDTPDATLTNCRHSHRVKCKRELQQSLSRNTEKQELRSGVECDFVIEETIPARCNSQGSGTEIKASVTPVVHPLYVEFEMEVDSRATQGLFGMCPRVPEDVLRCAGRQGTTRLLWLHEFFVVREGTLTERTCYVYQALQFLLGAHLPEGSVLNMTEQMRRDIWVLGVFHAPAKFVRQSPKRKIAYLFHSDSNAGDARTTLLGSCPELVRIDSSLKWHNMRNVSIEVPRVVHPEDVATRRVHVKGRKGHYVCGVSAVEDPATNTYNLSIIPRNAFCMYPEERLGMDINSATMMWDHIEDIFKKIRGCMSAGRQGTSSASFSMPLSGSVYAFWRVSPLSAQPCLPYIILYYCLL
jgi:hypothetical protein